MDIVKDFIRLFRQRIIRFFVRMSVKKIALTSKQTLIIAPHPDDETFGCAGLIVQKIQMDVEVYVLFLTKGEKSLHDIAEEEIKEMRQKSATDAVSVLGVDESHLLWLDFPDGDVPRKGSESFELAKNRVKEVMESLKIEEVYATHHLEGWPDHLAAYELSTEAVKELDREIDVYLYWVWAWYYVSLKQMFSLPWKKIYLLPIRSVFNKKQQALNVYFDSKTEKGELYIGKLPKVFLKAFEWPYEVYEKVEFNDV